MNCDGVSNTHTTTSDDFKELKALINDRFNSLQEANDERFNSLRESNEEIKQQYQIRNLVVSALRRDNCELNKRVKTLEERVIQLEKQVNNVESNNRKSNIEVAGIPEKIADRELRRIVANLFNHVADSEIRVEDIECAHRIFSKSSPQPTIVRLKRNLIDDLKSKDSKKKLKDVAVKMGWPKETKIYLNDNLSQTMKSVSYNARLLKNDGFISDTWFSNAAVRIKCNENDKTIKVTHEKDLIDLFPNYTGFTFDRDFYRRLRDDDEMEKLQNLSGNYGSDYGDWDDDVDNDLSSDGSASSVETVVEIGMIDRPPTSIANGSDQALLTNGTMKSPAPPSEEAAAAKEEVINHVRKITNPPSLNSGKDQRLTRSKKSKGTTA